MIDDFNNKIAQTKEVKRAGVVAKQANSPEILASHMGISLCPNCPTFQSNSLLMESNEGLLKSLNHCIYVGNLEEAPGAIIINNCNYVHIILITVFYNKEIKA